jgi:hypothetical protein
VNARFATHGLKPPSDYKTIDTLKIARRVFKFDSNKLDNLGRYLDEGRKIPNTGAALWRGCCEGDKKSWKKMRRYNAQDVLLLERVYNRLRPWAKSHPNLTLYTDKPGCPVCSHKHVMKWGYRFMQKRKVQRYRCQADGCGHLFI